MTNAALALVGLAVRAGVAAADAVSQTPILCDAKTLPAVNCPAEEHGVDWVAFLESTCELCPVGQQCETLTPDSPPLTIASNVAKGAFMADAMSFQCVAGVLAAMVVVSQYYLVRTSPEIVNFFTLNRSLRPFPFHTSQYALYTNMVPMRLMTCDDSIGDEARNRFVPKAHLEDKGLCGMKFTDEQLVRRCRSRLKSHTASQAPRQIATLREINMGCPSGAHHAVDAELSRKIEKYVARSEAQHCSTHMGMWRQGMSEQHKCVLVTVAHFLGFRPKQLVLDWGSGCGHKLSWAKMLFDVDGLGLDIMGAAVAWAQEHSAGSFCHADGRDLRWIPDGTFDYVISYAAIYHMSKDDQCLTGIQLAAKLRVGGKAFFGWNHGDSGNMESFEWFACFREARQVLLGVNPGTSSVLGQSAAESPALPGAIAAVTAGLEVETEAIEDGFLFPPDARKLTGNDSFLFQYPAYSLFFTRVA